jgi:hypothetical protein
MSNLSSQNAPANLRRRRAGRVAAGLVAALLTLGAVSVSAPASAEPASAASLLKPRGAWQGFSFTRNGAPLLGAKIGTDKGGLIAFMTNGDTLSLVLMNPNWDLKIGHRAPVRVRIDNESFIGTAVVSDRASIEIPDVSLNVFKGFADGAKAEINVNNGDVVYKLDLGGFTAAMSDALEAQKRSNVSY